MPTGQAPRPSKGHSPKRYHVAPNHRVEQARHTHHRPCPALKDKVGHPLALVYPVPTGMRHNIDLFAYRWCALLIC